MSTTKGKKKTIRVPVKAAATRMEAAMARTNKTARRAARARRAAADAATVQAKADPPAQKLRLSPAQKKKYLGLLARLHDKINKQIAFLANDSLNKTDNDEPRDDVTDDFDRDFALSLLTSEHDILFEINQAIQRIQEQTYGRCEQCNGTIGAVRLEAIPFARMCISCQATAEKDKSRYQPFGSTLSDVSKAAAGQTTAGSEE